MLLRRIIEHVTTQNWTAVVLDFIIVVAGVFLGLQVQEWAQERDRRQLEAAYVERLHDEVVDLEETRAPLISIRDRWNASLKSVTPVLFGEVDRPISAAECQSIGFSYVVSNPTDDLASLVELQTSGRLSMIRNAQATEALTSFLLTRARARDAQAGIAVSMRFLGSLYPDLVYVSSPTVTDDSPPVPATYECDLEGMRASRAFLNDFEVNQSNFSFHVNANSRVSESLAALHRLLDDTLGIAHDEPAT